MKERQSVLEDDSTIIAITNQTGVDHVIVEIDITNSTASPMSPLSPISSVSSLNQTSITQNSPDNQN